MRRVRLACNQWAHPLVKPAVLMQEYAPRPFGLPWLPTTMHMPRTKQLRPYQQQAVSALPAASRNRRVLHAISLPTGAGKTATCVSVCKTFLDTHENAAVLWLAPAWILLQQAYESVCEWASPYEDSCERLGGNGSVLHTLPPTDWLGNFLFTTPHTWNSRQQRREIRERFRPRKDLLVVMDECHWGANKRLLSTILQAHIGTSLVIGLSATLKELQGFTISPLCHRTFMDLAGKYLAVPTVLDLFSNQTWRAELSSMGDFSNTSLRQLASNSARNRAIVTHVNDGLHTKDYTRVLIFACDIQHAKTLHRLFSRAGTSVRLLHSQMAPGRMMDSLDDFRSGSAAVLVNVAMGNQGLDVPEIDCVVRTRPTTSPIRCAQEVGRGARRIPGKKETFRVVEVTDNCVREEMRQAIFQPVGLFEASPDKTQHSRDRPLLTHTEGEEEPAFATLPLPRYGEVLYAKGQTFGVEIELASEVFRECVPRSWRQGANLIASTISEVSSVGAVVMAQGSASVSGSWQVVKEYGGWEVVSPPLLEHEGFRELKAVCNALESLVTAGSFKVTPRTGLHVTLATRLIKPDQISGFFRRLQRIEPGLYTNVAPSRLYSLDGGLYSLDSPNVYCTPLRLADIREWDTRQFERNVDAERGVYLKALLGDVRLLEIRIHQGTTDYSKVALWTCLFMQIFNHSRYHWSGAGVVGPVLDGDDCSIEQYQADSEDLATLLLREGIALPASFAQALRTRREELRSSWEKLLPKRVQSWADCGWYSQSTAPRPQVHLAVNTGSFELRQTLLRACLDSDMSTAEIARRSGIDQSALNRFVKGTRPNMGAEVIEKLMPVLGVTVRADRVPREPSQTA